MNLKELKEVIELFTSRESIEELEIERAGVRVRMKRAGSPAAAAAAPRQTAPAGAPHLAVHAAPDPGLAAVAPAPGDDLVYVKSPMVGTFYRASAPTEKPFVSVGDQVEKGTVLCIVEAMKLMNEIESEVAGEIVATLMENGQPVEYGQGLFTIRPR